jgi:hypothetical protein
MGDGDGGWVMGDGPAPSPTTHRPVASNRAASAGRTGGKAALARHLVREVLADGGWLA